MSEQQTLLDVNPAARRDEDFYATPAWQTRALLLRLRSVIGSRFRFFEPSVGDGAIVRELPYHWDIVTNDIVQRDPMIPDFLLDARQPKSWDAFAARGPMNIIGSNLPFDVAFDIVPHAHAWAEGLVFFLLRLSWIEPTKARGTWLRDHPPTSVIVLPRTDYRGNGQTDSVTSAWFLWDRGFRLDLPAFDFVTVEERDALLAAGKGRPS